MLISRRALINTAVCATAAAVAPRVARAAYPERPIRLIVPFVPGGAVDAPLAGPARRGYSGRPSSGLQCQEPPRSSTSTRA